MKQYTKRDLQSMYEAPSQELKERIHQEILSLPFREEEGKIMKKRLSFRIAVIIAILLTLAAAAYAVTEVYHRIHVNWKGETVEDTVMPLTAETTTCPPSALSDMEISLLANDLLTSTVADDEYGTVKYETGGAGSPRQRMIDSWEEFLQAMADADYLTLPKWIPDGYTFENARLLLDCRYDGEYKLIEERQENGITLKRYAVDEADSVIIGYELLFRNSDEDYHYLAVYSYLEMDFDPNESLFEMQEGQTASPITILGMDNALAISGEGDLKMSSLSMRRVLSNTIECRYPPFYEGTPFEDEAIIYTQEDLTVHAPLLDTDILLKMFMPD